MVRLAVNIPIIGDCLLECLQLPDGGSGSGDPLDALPRPLFSIAFNAAFLFNGLLAIFGLKDIDFDVAAADMVLELAKPLRPLSCCSRRRGSLEPAGFVLMHATMVMTPLADWDPAAGIGRRLHDRVVDDWPWRRSGRSR